MADNFDVRDAANVVKTFRSTDAAGIHTPHRIGAASEAHIGEIGGKVLKVYNSFTRPANVTAYTAGDRVSASTSLTAPTILNSMSRVTGQGGYITAAKLTTDKKSITPRFRVHLYIDSAPTLSVDNAAYQSKYADDGIQLCTFDLPAMSTPIDTTNSDLSITQDANIRIPFITQIGVDDIWFALEVLDAFTPASGENFQLTLFGDLN